MSESPIRLVCIDDDPFVIELIEYIFDGNHAYDINAFTDAMEALPRLNELNPDLVLLDMLMPKIDGLEVLRQIKADPKLNRLNVAFLTAKTDEASINHYMSMGAVGVVSKPIIIEELPYQIDFIVRQMKG